MATGYIKSFGYRAHNISPEHISATNNTGWHGWKDSTSVSSYIATATHQQRLFTVFRFKVQRKNSSGEYIDIPNNAVVKSITFTIPTVQSSGTVYAKGEKNSDPTGGNSPIQYSKISDLIPTSSSHSTSAEISDNKAKITLTKPSISPNTYYYLKLGASKQIELSGTVSSSVTYYTTGGTPEVESVTDNGNNTITIKGKQGKSGTSNTIKSTTLTYKFSGGTAQTITLTASSEGTINKTINIPSGLTNGAGTVDVSVTSTFAEGDSKTSGINGTAVQYHVSGSAPGAPTITNKTNNTFTITGKTSANATGNNLVKTVIYYTTNGNTPATGDAGDKNGTTKVEWSTSKYAANTDYTLTVNTPSSSKNTTVKAFARSTFSWGSSEDDKYKSSSVSSGKVYYYNPIGNPDVTITDNYNNTFEISGTDAAAGWNNTATTNYSWGYDSNYSGTGTGNKTLTITTKTNATRKVYAKAVATPSWTGDTTRQVTAELAIKQYVAPGDPSNITITPASRSRLTIKEHWIVNWTAAKKTNDSSPVVGYRIRIFKKSPGETAFTTIKFYSKTTGKVLSTADGTDNYYDRDSTDTSMWFYPDAQQGQIRPGDTIKISMHAYTKKGKDNDGTRIFSSTPIYSPEYEFKNAGVVNVRVSGQWKEGQVYVKVGGVWKEAETVNTRVNGAWKESQ